MDEPPEKYVRVCLSCAAEYKIESIEKRVLVYNGKYYGDGTYQT